MESANKGLYSQLNNIRMVAFDFDGVFTDNKVIVSQDGTESVICNRSDGLGISYIKKLGIHVIVISTEQNPVVSARCNKLEIPCFQGISNKFEVLMEQAGKHGITLDKISYMGNDTNDLECIRKVGFPVCVCDAHNDVKPEVKYITTNCGGHGAVRELCDLIIKAKNGKFY